ncbi:membrane protein [Microbacterium phage Hager]|nr:membrane protein [Microbacterium phage Rie18]UYL85374.1 membrane protein [Microbacterium phage Hager]
MIILLIIVGLIVAAFVIYLMWIGLAGLITVIREASKGWRAGWNKEK